VKGKGHGGALLRHALRIARDAGVPAHLETGNPANLPLYRRFGLEVRQEIVSHGGPPLWVMTAEQNDLRGL
jgi:GNAT superfamily N-acetyltransferase